MRVFAISDLHLSFAADKPMDLFGEAWRDHVERLSAAWRETVREDVSERIFAAGEKEGRMLLTLASGNVTLRADRVFAALKGLTGCDGDVSDVVKTEQFFREDGVLVPVREALVRKE